MGRRHSIKKTTRDPSAIDRLGGHPIGIGVENWPTILNPNTKQKQPMIHVLTVSASSLTSAGVELPKGVAALALFVSSPWNPLFFDDPTADYEVIALRASDVEKGELEGPELLEAPMRSHGLRIGSAGSPRSNFAGGSPRYIQDDEGSDGFVLQINDRLVDINLGDSGELYMYTNWAQWQCH